MEKRATALDEIADIVLSHAPKEASGYYVNFANTQGIVVRQPEGNFWRLNPLESPVNLPQCLLHIVFLDVNQQVIKSSTPDQRLVIDLVFDPSLRGATQSVVQQAGPASSVQLSKLAEELESKDPERIAEEASVRQEVARGELELLTVDTLQKFLRETLTHFIRLQDVATKTANAQIASSIENMNLLVSQSTQLLQTQLEMSKVVKEKIGELQPPPMPPSTDIGGILASVLPFIQNIWLGTIQSRGLAPASVRGRLPASVQKASTATLSSNPEGDEIQDADLEVPRVGTVSEAQFQAAVGVLKRLTDPEQMTQILTDPEQYAKFVEELRRRTLHQGAKPASAEPAPGGSKATSEDDEKSADAVDPVSAAWARLFGPKGGKS